MLFKAIPDLEIWWPFCSAICAILVEGNYEEQFCEIILNLNQWRCLLKIFLIWSSGDPFVQQSGTICAILVECIERNNSVK